MPRKQRGGASHFQHVMQDPSSIGLEQSVLTSFFCVSCSSYSPLSFFLSFSPASPSPSFPLPLPSSSYSSSSFLFFLLRPSLVFVALPLPSSPFLFLLAPSSSFFFRQKALIVCFDLCCTMQQIKKGAAALRSGAIPLHGNNCFKSV